MGAKYAVASNIRWAAVRFASAGKRIANGLLPHHWRYVGVVLAVLGFLVSLEPSLLPRPWILQVVVSTIVSLLAYGLGVSISWVLRLAWTWQSSVHTKLLIWQMTGVVSALLISFQLVRGAVWQRETYRLIGEQQPSLNWVAAIFGVLVGTLILGGLIIGALTVTGRLLGRLFGWLRDKRLLPYIHVYVLRSLLAALVVGLVIFAANGTLRRAADAVTRYIYETHNRQISQGALTPDDPLKSGSKESLVSWQNLGYEGRQFVSSAPTTGDITKVTGKPAMDPIRAYVGLEQTHGDIPAAANVAVKELERTHAFNRSVLLVVVTTGTGWVDPGSTKPLEYLLDGDVATVAIQYSYYPSWLSFLRDRDKVVEAGQATIRAVTSAVAALPPGAHHPQILLFGESLGSYGAENDLLNEPSLPDGIAGTVLAGPPGFNPLHRQLTAQRNPGSPSYDPVVGNEQNVVFASNPGELAKVHSSPKLIYLQNPTDPVAKWDTTLLWRKPSWLEEEKHAGLIAWQFTWMPVVTFFQVTVDMILSTHVPPGYGHNYGTHAEAAWELLTGRHFTEAQRGQISHTLLAK